MAMTTLHYGWLEADACLCANTNVTADEVKAFAQNDIALFRLALGYHVAFSMNLV